MVIKNINNAFRNIWRNKFFSFINIIGLSVGLAGSFFMLLYILQETGYNKCHINHKNIYRVLRTDDQYKITQPYTPYYFSEYLLKDFPEVKKSARIGYIFGVSFKKNNDFIPEYVVYGADPSIFDIFTLPVISGNKNDFLKSPSSVVITKRIADKYFPDGNATGKEMKMRLNNKTFVLTVDGVIKDIPLKSTFRGQIFCHIDFVWERSKRYYKDEKLKYSWSASNYETYILVPDNFNIRDLENKIPAFIKKYGGEKITSKYSFQPFDSIYFNSRQLSNTMKWGDIQKIYTFVLIALLILFIAAVNYIILSTAQAVTRFKEIGIKKTIGASRKILVKQIFTESIVTTLLAVPVSILIMYFSLSFVNYLLRTNLHLEMLLNLKAVTGLIIITVIVGLFSGSFLAVFLTKLNPVEALRNTNLIKNSRSWFRFTLIILQIVIFVVLLIFLQTISAQINYAENTNQGYNKENLIKIFIDDDFLPHLHEFIETIKNNPNIINASAASYTPPDPGWQKIEFPDQKQKNKVIVVEQLDVDYDFVKTLELNIIQGRDFSKDFGSDDGNAVLISKSAIKTFELPDNATGSLITRSDSLNYKVIGVFDDIYMRSLKEKITPMIICLTKDNLWEIVVRYRQKTDTSTISFLKKTMNDFVPDEPLEYINVKDAIKNLYMKEIQLKKTFNLFTLLAIFISMLGIFALSVFLIRQKAKTIGIRKVYGATTKTIIKLIVTEFMAMVFAANIIGIPIALYISNRWLSEYAYHTGFSLQPYIIAFSASFLLVFITVVTSVYKISNINPAKSIKYQE